ncbi:hypothetical protein KKE60_08490 [Patescibacteria group bacterium]|nr:hypothetical protein [Patescibacteria group bacterium]
MISILQARKLTGSYLKYQTDEQIQNLINQVYGLAEIAVEEAILHGSNKTRGVIELDKRKEQNGSNRA